MYLVLKGSQYEIAQLGPEHCILREAESFPSAAGEIVLIIDGAESRIPAFFTAGASKASRRVPYVRLSTTPANSLSAASP